MIGTFYRKFLFIFFSISYFLFPSTLRIVYIGANEVMAEAINSQAKHREIKQGQIFDVFQSVIEIEGKKFLDQYVDTLKFKAYRNNRYVFFYSQRGQSGRIEPGYFVHPIGSPQSIDKIDEDLFINKLTFSNRLTDAVVYQLLEVSSNRIIAKAVANSKREKYKEGESFHVFRSFMQLSNRLVLSEFVDFLKFAQEEREKYVFTPLWENQSKYLKPGYFLVSTRLGTKKNQTQKNKKWKRLVKTTSPFIDYTEPEMRLKFYGGIGRVQKEGGDWSTIRLGEFLSKLVVDFKVATGFGLYYQGTFAQRDSEENLLLPPVSTKQNKFIHLFASYYQLLPKDPRSFGIIPAKGPLQLKLGLGGVYFQHRYVQNLNPDNRLGQDWFGPAALMRLVLSYNDWAKSEINFHATLPYRKLRIRESSSRVRDEATFLYNQDIELNFVFAPFKRFRQLEFSCTSLFSYARNFSGIAYFGEDFSYWDFHLGGELAIKTGAY